MWWLCVQIGACRMPRKPQIYNHIGGLCRSVPFPKQRCMGVALGKFAPRCLKAMRGVNMAHARIILARTLQRACEA